LSLVIPVPKEEVLNQMTKKEQRDWKRATDGADGADGFFVIFWLEFALINCGVRALV
jgi:hypothetical protein